MRPHRPVSASMAGDRRGRIRRRSLLGRTTLVEYDLNMGKGRVDFDRGIARLASYARYHGHANPKADDVWLEWSVGLWVASLRTKYRSNKLTEEQIAAAVAIGVRFTPPYRDPKPKSPSRSERKVTDDLERLRRLVGFYGRHGHINVPQLTGTDDWPGAGRWIARLRSQYRHGQLADTVIEAAESMNIDWNPGQGARKSLRADDAILTTQER